MSEDAGIHPYTVCQGPYRSGTSRQGQPTRTRQLIPSMSGRLFHFAGGLLHSRVSPVRNRWTVSAYPVGMWPVSGRRVTTAPGTR